jgi:diguanylate cyclase (GGDEF)-like protein
MSDSETPQHDPERDGAPDSSANGSSDPHRTAAQLAQTTESPSAGEDSELTTGADSTAGDDSHVAPAGREEKLLWRRKAAWVAAAAVCVSAGTIGSLLAAHALARSDSADARQSFNRTSAGIAATVSAAIQHEEDLAISAGTFFAGNPKAKRTELDTWAGWAKAFRRYPELDRLSLLALVPAQGLTAFETQVAGHAPKRAGALSATPAGGGLRIIPAGQRPYYCFTLASIAGAAGRYPPAGLDYCAVSGGLLRSRDSGHSSYARVSADRTSAVEVQTPVYRGNVTPSTVTARMGAFVGWLSEVLAPKVVLAQALGGHPDFAVRLGRRSGSSHLAFSTGAPRPGARRSTVALHGGWTLTSFGAPAEAGLLADGSALAVFIAGTLLSVLLALLVLALGLGRTRARARMPKTGGQRGDVIHDAVTGLPSRALTLDRAERMVARVGRQSGLVVGALFVEVDWVKDVNEKLGDSAGDQLLRIVAERLEGVVRAGDTVGRLDGDEFVILVETVARGVRLDALARRAIESLHKPVELDGFGPSFFLTVSIGVAFGRYAASEDLLRDAHLALDAARAAGKDRYALFNANMRSVTEGQGVLDVELNGALLDKQFFLLYQPIYDLTTRQVIGLEALIRWLHPTRGVLPPGDFIPLAEETGLIVPIGRWVLEEACSRAAAWNVAGNHVGISVAVTSHQLHRDGFVTDVRRALQQSGLEPSSLTLEVAETAVIGDIAAAAERLHEVKQLGVRIAIDDFGSGYAYRSDLQRMPIDFLKVDRSALAASEDEDYRTWLLEAILIFARDLSLTVIAKGIETSEHIDSLTAMGCTLAQGFFFGAPTPADIVVSLFESDLGTEPAPASSTALPGQLPLNS